MDSITIITIVVVALLTLIIFGLAWLAYSSCVKSYKMEVDKGIHDKEIHKEYHNKKKGGLLGLIGSYVTLSLFLGLFVFGLIYKVNGDNISINNHTALVIKSNSMSDFYNDEIANQYDNDKTLQFDVGDICMFDTITTNDEFTIGDVYGYRYKNIIITHRLVSINDGFYEFRGDNNPTNDGPITKDKILYHYTGDKIKGIGSFVLYAQSYFGMWSLVGISGVLLGSEIVYHKVNKIEKDRYELIRGMFYEK